MNTRIAGRLLLAITVLAIAAGSTAALAQSPRLKEVRKIYVGMLSPMGEKRGRMVVVEHTSPKEVNKRLVAALVSSGRFAVVTTEKDADARLEGTAGYIKSEDNGVKHTTGFAQLKLIDPKSDEILWVFEYKPQAGAGGSAAQRVADQAVEKLVADAKSVDAR
jgi:hypothetical protein